MNRRQVYAVCARMIADKVAAARPKPRRAQIQNYKQALAEALGHRSYILLVLGFFTCGFQLGFVTLHLPSYLIDRGLSAEVGGWTLGVIGLFNIVGAMTSGWLGGRMPKRYILAVIYFARALAVVFLITLPASPAVALDLRRRDRAALAVIGAADRRPGRRDVRHALDGHAVRHRVLQPSGRRLPRRLSRRRCCTSAPVPTTSCGGSACCSACCPPSSICRSSRSRWRGSRWRRPRWRIDVYQ